MHFIFYFCLFAISLLVKVEQVVAKVCEIENVDVLVLRSIVFLLLLGFEYIKANILGPKFGI